MKYKVGDKVRVREDLEVHKLYGREAFASQMVPLKGKIVTINKVVGYRCEIAEDPFRCWWTEEMFSPIITKYKIGDKVRIREDLIVDQWYGEDTFASGMVSFKGKVVTISNIESGFYTLKEDSGRWDWTSEMFSGKVSEDFSPKEFISQSTIPEGESSFDIITIKPTKVKLLLL